MTRITARRVFLAILAALHFVAVPCVMAMAAPGGEEPCEHCHTGVDPTACATTSTTPADDDAAPAPGKYRDPDPPRTVALLLPPLAADGGSRDPAPRFARRAGRHSGDPPLTVLYGRFLN